MKRNGIYPAYFGIDFMFCFVSPSSLSVHGNTNVVNERVFRVEVNEVRHVTHVS